MSRASTAAASSVDAAAKNDEREKDDLLASACVSFAIVLCMFAMWSTYSPSTVSDRDVTVSHIRHLVQHGSSQLPVPLSPFNSTRLGLDDDGVFLVLLPRDWQKASWSHVVVRFTRYPFDKVRSIEVHLRQVELRTFAWVEDRLILDAALNRTMSLFDNLFVPCQGAYTTLGFAFFRLKESQWDEAVIVRASRLIKEFPLVKIDDAMWLSGIPSSEDRWKGRVRHIVDIPGNISLFRTLVDGREHED